MSETIASISRNKSNVAVLKVGRADASHVYNSIGPGTYKMSYFSGIHLIPNKVSKIKTRSVVDTSTMIGEIRIDVPIMNSPMRDVANAHVVNEMFAAGGFGVLHRFDSIETNVEEYRSCPSGAACSLGIGDEDIERYRALYSIGCRNFCIDIANGANKNAIDFIKKNYSKAGTNLIGANIAHPNQLKKIEKNLENLGSVRLGYATGAACTTKNATGIVTDPVDMLNAFKKYRSKTARILDGGVGEPGDLCKAVALGADACMLGSKFAACKDSPAEEVEVSGVVYKSYSGSASVVTQQYYRDEPRYIEGTTRHLTPNEMTVRELVQSYKEGLQSSMSYFGAETLDEFRECANFSY